MAKIVQFKELTSEPRTRAHSKVECGYRAVTLGGETLLQLDTYGSDDRKIPGKLSQSLQLDRAGADELVRIIRKVFG